MGGGESGQFRPVSVALVITLLTPCRTPSASIDLLLTIEVLMRRSEVERGRFGLRSACVRRFRILSVCGELRWAATALLHNSPR
jgi:hypothetical protein